MNDITIPPSIYIFHDINCLYLIFHELEQDQEPRKPKLQIHNDIILSPTHKKTKKVTFKEDFRHTRRKDHETI